MKMSKKNSKSANATATEKVVYRVVKPEATPRRMELGAILETIDESDIVKVWRKTYEREIGNITVVAVYTRQGTKQVFDKTEGGEFTFRTSEPCQIEAIKVSQ